MAISGGDGSIILTTKVDESGINSGLSKMKSGIGRIGKAFAVLGGAGAAAFVGITKAAVDSYAEFEQLSGGVQKIFNEIDYSKIAEDAGNAYKTMGMSANEYLGVMTTVGANFASTLGDAKGYEVAKQGMQAISDFASGTGRSVDELSEKYQMITKSTSSYQSIADQFAGILPATSAEFLKQAKAAGFLSESYTKLTDVPMAEYQEAVTQMLSKGVDALGLTGNTAMEAATTLSGSIAMMKASWQNLLTGIVDENADLPTLMNNVFESVLAVFDNLEPAISKTMETLPLVVSRLGEKIFDAIPDMLVGVVPNIVNGVSTLINALLSSISKSSSVIGKTFGDALIVIVGEVVKLTPKLIEAGANMVKGFATGILSAVNSVSPALTVLSTSIIAAFSAVKLIPVFTAVVNGINGIKTALTAYQVAVAASQNVSLLLASTLTPLQLIVGVLTGKVSLATAAQIAWNAAMSINPVVLAVGAIALLVGAIVGATFAYDNHIKKTSELVIATQQMVEKSAEAVEQTNQLTSSMQSLHETAETSIIDAEAEAYANEKLVEELYNLSEQANITTSEKERMRQIIDDLNGGYSDLNLQLDEETGKLSMSKEAIQEVIDKKLEMAKANAMQELYTDYLKEQYKAEADAIGNARKRAEAQDELNEILSQGTTKIARYEGKQHEVTTYTREQELAMADLKDAIKNYDTALNNNKQSGLDAVQNIKDLSTATGVELPESFATASLEAEGFYDGLISGGKNANTQSPSLGGDYGDGYAEGIRKKGDEAYQAGFYLGQQAKKGTQAGQNSSSPSIEAMHLGEDYGDGYDIGIESKEDEIYDRGYALAEKALEGTKDAKEKGNRELLESEKLYQDEKNRIEKEREENAFLENIEEINKAYDKSVADAKKRYEEKAELEEKIEEANAEKKEKIEKLKQERIAKIRREAEEEYLDLLEDDAEKERKILEENQKSVTDAYKNIMKSATDAMKNLLKNQQSLAKKLFDFGDLYTVVEEVQNAFANTFPLIEKNKLANPAYKAQTLQRYYDKLMEVKERGVPDEFFDMLKNMGYEEGLEYALKLLQLGDKQFKDYIKNWVGLQETGKSISEALFGNDEAEKDSKKILADISEQTDAVENYFDLIMQIKNKDNVPKAFFESLRDMGVAEGTEYANALLGLSDEEFQKYITDWARDKSVSEEISKMLYADEAETIASEITEAFAGLDSQFFGLGEDAFVNFGKGFVEKMGTVVEGMKTTIGSTFMDILPFGDIVTTPFAIPSIANGGVVPYSATRVLPFGGIYSGYSSAVPYEVSYNERGTTTVVLQVNERELGRVTLDAATLESERVGTTLISK